MPSIDPGRLDRRITIQTLDVTRGVAGGVIEGWTAQDPIWAEKIEQGSREFRTAGTLHSECTRMFRIRHRTGVTAKDRVLFDGRIHEILGDPVEEGRKEFLLIQVKFTGGRA